MSEADKMFEELGYKKEETNDYISYAIYTEFSMYIESAKFVPDENGIIKDIITFWKKGKTVTKHRYLEAGSLTMQELKAINKKVEELGWM